MISASGETLAHNGYKPGPTVVTPSYSGKYYSVLYFNTLKR